MSRMAMGRIVRMSLGGAVGGLLGFGLLEPTLRAAEEQQFVTSDLLEAAARSLQHVALLGMVIGACIGVALIVTEEVASRRPLRLLRLALYGFLVGSLCGLVGSFVGQISFAVFVALQLQVIGRAIGWGLMGAAAGLCPGTVTRSPRRTAQGMVGGLVGGLLGGLAFDAIGQLNTTGAYSRFVGFTLMGWMIGFAVGLVEEFGKEYWLTLLTGAKEGRSFIIARPNTILGRDELADIPLFGDSAVQRQHAIVSSTNQGIFIAAAPGQALSVNNQVTSEHALADGDIVSIGSYRLRFNARAKQDGRNQARQEPASAAQPSYVVVPMPTLPPPGLPLDLLPATLEVSDGPNRGQTFTLTDGAIVWRDPRCDIALTRNAQASRQHARLILVEETDAAGRVTFQWFLHDGGSSNGTWVNGRQVTTSVLQSGDEIRVGQSALRVN